MFGIDLLKEEMSIINQGVCSCLARIHRSCYFRYLLALHHFIYLAVLWLPLNAYSVEQELHYHVSFSP